MKKNEAGEVHSHAPWALLPTRLARWRSAAATVCNFPEQTEHDIALPDLPHAREVFVEPWQKKVALVSIHGLPAQCFFLLVIWRQENGTRTFWHVRPLEIRR